MSLDLSELRDIMVKFAESGWDLISIPAKAWLEGKGEKDALILDIPVIYGPHNEVKKKRNKECYV